MEGSSVKDPVGNMEESVEKDPEFLSCGMEVERNNEESCEKRNTTQGQLLFEESNLTETEPVVEDKKGSNGKDPDYIPCEIDGMSDASSNEGSCERRNAMDGDTNFTDRTRNKAFF